ncbi:hypothetical protein L3Q82_013788 [Scortum barcoo]|uniref:Uncharacterized protein n=1 Tax=Scortum barcoo TaxID=214431 RepID=A0ACB8VVR1_9TELE|nr:hypothetical protein L3Q82_013788 [Scortum barcoo]
MDSRILCSFYSVLQHCDPALLAPCGDSEQPDSDEAAKMVLHLTDSRRVQKVLWRQLFVLDSMMSLLEGLESAQQLMTQPCPPPPEGGARGRWKALKAESRSAVEEMETLLRSLQERIQQINDRRHTLTHSWNSDICTIRCKQQCEDLGESLQKAHNALQSCDHQLTLLRAESEAVLGQLIGWQGIREELQESISAIQNVMQINLLSVNQSELCVELRPRPPTNQMSNELEPLKLSVNWSNWSHDDCFRLQVNEGTAGLVEGCVRGRQCELSAALLEVMQCYMGHFAIDWRPAQRLLVYLKSALLVCHLEVEEGYPSAGRARLLTVRRDGRPVDTSALKVRKLQQQFGESRRVHVGVVIAGGDGGLADQRAQSSDQVLLQLLHRRHVLDTGAI